MLTSAILSQLAWIKFLKTSAKCLDANLYTPKAIDMQSSIWAVKIYVLKEIKSWEYMKWHIWLYVLAMIFKSKMYIILDGFSVIKYIWSF